MKLCYIKDHCAWFTDNFEKQWGDDWNDKPYETNAEEPYDHWTEDVRIKYEFGYKVRSVVHPIKLKKVFFDFEDWGCYTILPCDRGRFSVQEINRGITPWIWTQDFRIDAGTELEEFIRIIKENGGEVYLPIE